MMVELNERYTDATFRFMFDAEEEPPARPRPRGAVRTLYTYKCIGYILILYIHLYIYIYIYDYEDMCIYMYDVQICMTTCTTT